MGFASGSASTDRWMPEASRDQPQTMVDVTFLAFCQKMLGLNNFLPTNEFSIKPLKVKLLAGEQKATELF